MEASNSFKLNTARAFMPNIQFTVLVHKDRLVFVKTGGQFADMHYVWPWIIATLLATIVFAALGTVLVVRFVPDGTVKTYLTMLPTVIGLFGGYEVGNHYVKKYVKPKQNIQSGQDFNSASPDELLLRDKHNFSLPFSEITYAAYDKSSMGSNGPIAGRLHLNGRNFEVAPGQDLKQVIAMLEAVLPCKITEGLGM